MFLCCSGPCLAGCVCSSGSTSPSQSYCPPGTYSLSGSSSCSPCPAGRYGATSGLSSADCSGPCDAGYYGNVTGLTTASCSGLCAVGYVCYPGSVSPTPSQCQAGTYAVNGALCLNCTAGLYGSSVGLSTSACSGPCAAGFYGAASGMTKSNCSGACPAGYYCPAGTVSYAAKPCPAGTYSTTGMSVCFTCSAGRFGAEAAMPTAACSGLCPSGRFGNQSGVSSPQCTYVACVCLECAKPAQTDGDACCD